MEASGLTCRRVLCVVDELGKGAVRTMAIIKNALDPHNILNPGKLLHQVRHPSTSLPLFTQGHREKRGSRSGHSLFYQLTVTRLLDRLRSTLFFVSRSFGRCMTRTLAATTCASEPLLPFSAPARFSQPLHSGRI